MKQIQLKIERKLGAIVGIDSINLPDVVSRERSGEYRIKMEIT